MKCLSLKQPWATLIVGKTLDPSQAIKPIENRTWKSSYRGGLLIHASKTWDEEGAQWICGNFPMFNGLIRHSRHPNGYIVGKVDMVDCVTEHNSPWFFGPYGFVFRNPIEFYGEESIPYKGKLGIFEIKEKEIIAKVRRLLKKT